MYEHSKNRIQVLDKFAHWSPKQACIEVTLMHIVPLDITGRPSPFRFQLRGTRVKAAMPATKPGFSIELNQNFCLFFLAAAFHSVHGRSCVHLFMRVPLPRGISWQVWPEEKWSNSDLDNIIVSNLKDSLLEPNLGTCAMHDWSATGLVRPRFIADDFSFLWLKKIIYIFAKTDFEGTFKPNESTCRPELWPLPKRCRPRRRGLLYWAEKDRQLAWATYAEKVVSATCGKIHLLGAWATFRHQIWTILWMEARRDHSGE